MYSILLLVSISDHLSPRSSERLTPVSSNITPCHNIGVQGRIFGIALLVQHYRILFLLLGLSVGNLYF